jgi:hypothetical protein
VLKHYYRLVHWKRRIARAIGHRPQARSSYYHRSRTHQWMSRARPLLVFSVLVLIVLAVSYTFGSRQGAGLYWSVP